MVARKLACRAWLSVEALEDRTTPATLTVTTLADAVNAADGVLSLREAVQDAAPGDTIDFQSGLTGTIALGSTLSIARDLTISGPGRSVLTVSPNNMGNSLFSLSSGISVALSGLTVAGGGAVYGGGIRNDGGSLSVSNCAFSGNTANSQGGAIYSNSGSLTVTNCTFSDNGQLFGAKPEQGGAIFSSLSTLTVSDCTFTNNIASSWGGGLYAFGAPTASNWVTNCAFSGNLACGAGGGIAAFGFGRMTVSNSTFSGNEVSGSGGGIHSRGPLTVSNSTFTGNRADMGGAISGRQEMTVSNSTIVGNFASSMAGGISCDLSGGTFVYGPLTLSNTIVARNQAQGPVGYGGFGPEPDIFLPVPVSSLGHNLIGDVRSSTGWIASDLTGTAASPLDPLLDDLRDNGGPTRTMAPRFGSPAIDAGDNANGGLPVPATDQRGRTRIGNGSIDIGAFETQPSVLQPEVVAVWTGTGTNPITRSVNQANLATHLAAVADITPHPSANPVAQIIFDLGGNTVTGPTARVPTGVSLTFQNGTFVGASPALTVLFGTVTVRDSTLTNATDAPTVRLAGGSLTLRNSVVQESTGYDQTAILVEGGSLDLGTPADPGGNTINVNGTGQLLANAGGFPATLYGTTWQENGTTLPGGTVGSGQAAGIGFWANHNGRALLNALGTNRAGVSLAGQWLAAAYPNLYGSLSGSTPDGVWDYLRALKGVTGASKLEAQVMATALSVYVTDTTLNATALGRATAEKYGFVLGNGSLGSEAAAVNNDQASALGLSGGAGYYTVSELLAAANSRASGGWLFLAPDDSTKRKAVHDLFASINEAGSGG